MAVTADTFIFPTGTLRAAMLGASPDELRAALAARIAEGQGKVSAAPAEQRDAALVAYVYWKLYEAAVVYRATEATQTSIPQDYSETFGGSQLAALRRLADGHRQAYEDAVAAATPRGQPRSTSVPTVVTWA